MATDEMLADQHAEGEHDDVAPAESAVDPSRKKIWDEFRRRVATTKMYRRKLIRNWSINVDFRRGKSFASQEDNDTVAVNLDWSYTKTKQAALFSQVPKGRVSHPPDSLAAPWVAQYERAVNDELVKAGIEATMDEVLPDCINAAGFGVAYVACESITKDKQVPAIDLSIFPPAIQTQAMQTGQLFGQPIPMETVPDKLDTRYVIRRISPADFLWPVDFTGSNFDNAPWLGYTGRMPWAEAKAKFKLDDEDKNKYRTEERTVVDRIVNDLDKGKTYSDDMVGFDEIFYHEYQYDSEAKSFSTIHHLVFLHGKEEPVIDEPWKGQVEDPNNPGKIIGSKKSPIRVLTLAYLTDEDIPPSDSAIGRPYVKELNTGRTHFNRQRSRYMPWTWFDVNRLDPSIQGALLRGTWQNGAIPVQGDGSRILGSIQQPPINAENFTFDQIAKADLQEAWTIGPNQLGVGGDVETRGEANTIESNFQTKIGRERARVESFVVGIIEVLGSLMCLFEDPSRFGEGFDPAICNALSYSILTDSTVLVSTQQRLDRLNGFLNTYAKSGWVNIEPVLKEIAQLIGLDPNSVIKAPEPQQPEQPNISLRLTGADDMMNPLLLAFMIKAGQAPEPELVEKAKSLIQASVQMQQQIAPPQPPVPPGGMPQPAPPPIGEANPQAGLLPAINKRSEDGNGAPGEAQ